MCGRAQTAAMPATQQLLSLVVTQGFGKVRFDLTQARPLGGMCRQEFRRATARARGFTHAAPYADRCPWIVAGMCREDHSDAVGFVFLVSAKAEDEGIA